LRTPWQFFFASLTPASRANFLNFAAHAFLIIGTISPFTNLPVKTSPVPKIPALRAAASETAKSRCTGTVAVVRPLLFSVATLTIIVFNVRCMCEAPKREASPSRG
jgi:hypothetical protein